MNNSVELHKSNVSFSGTFEKLQKASLVFAKSVCPSVRNNSDHSGRIFVEFHVQGIPVLWYLNEFFPKYKNVRIEVVEKIKIHISRHAHRFPTSCSICNNYEKYKPGRQAIKSSEVIWCRDDSTSKSGVITKMQRVILLFPSGSIFDVKMHFSRSIIKAKLLSHNI